MMKTHHRHGIDRKKDSNFARRETIKERGRIYATKTKERVGGLVKKVNRP